jgi:hypothetical protein
MSYKHIEDIQNIYENISEPIDQNLIDEATAVLIDSMLSQGFSENAILEYARNADVNELVERILDASEDYILVEDITVPLLSTLNEDVDPNNYLPEELELSIEHTQSIERLHEGVGKLLGRAAPFLQKVASKGKNLIKRVAGKGNKVTGGVDSIKSASKAGKGQKITGGVDSIKSASKAGKGQKITTTKGVPLDTAVKGKKTLFQRAGDTVKKIAKNPLAQGAVGGLGVMAGIPLAVGTAKLAGKAAKAVGGAIKTGVDNAKTFVKGGADAVKDKNISKQVDDYVAKNKGDKPIRKIDPTPYNKPKSKVVPGSEKIIPARPANASGKELPKARTIGPDKGQVNPNSARGKMIAQNKERFGGDKVEKLRDKNAAFQKAKKKGSGYSMDDFAKDFPNSNTAKKRNKRNRVTSVMDMESYDAFDIVSNYLFESNQVDNMDEALYVMSEMDAKTIQDIVSQNTK